MFSRVRLFSSQSRILEKVRNTVKPLESRKTFLVDFYKDLDQNNSIILFTHRNNLVKQDNNRFRQEIAEAGGKLTILRNRIFQVYLRSKTHSDPASKKASKEVHKNSAKHPLEPLLRGPTAAIAIKECDPSVVRAVLKVLKSANERLFLVGAKIENQVYDLNQVNDFKELPTKPELHSQLAGILTFLGGAGLVQTLESTSNVMYLTLDSHRKAIDPSEEK